MDWWLLSALAGIWLGTQLDPTQPFWGWILMSIGSGAVAVAYSWIYPRLPRMPGRLVNRTAILSLSGVLCGIVWALINAKAVLYANLNANLLQSEVDSTSVVQVRIDSLVDNNDQRWRFDGKDLEHGRLIRLSWYTPEGVMPRSGEVWEFTISTRPISSRLNQGGFNYQAYLIRHGIHLTAVVRDGSKVDGPGPGLSAVRQVVFDQFERHRSQLPNLDILLALALGERQWISAERWQILQYTGLAHLMAISGLHLTIVFGTCFVLLRRTLPYFVTRNVSSKFPVLYLALGGAWIVAFGYAALAGFAVATLRALILISLFLILRLLVIRLSPMRVWLRTVALVLVLDPLAWLDAGFWLSALAVAAIFIWNWRISGTTARNWRDKVRALWWFEVMLAFTLFPLSVAFFHGTSWVAPLTNMIGIPLFTFWVLPLTLIGVVIGWVSESAGYVVWWLADRALALLWLLLYQIDQISWVHWADSRLAWVVLAAAVIIKWPAMWRYRAGSLVALSVSAGWIIWWEPDFYQRDPRLTLHMLDVGQGSALVVQRGRRALLVDAGPAYPGGLDMGSAVIIPFLRYHRLQPDILFLSHPHRDHTGGAEALRQAYPQLTIAGIDTTPMHCAAGQVWAWQGISIHHLAPLAGPSYGANNDSCVMRLRYQGEQVLLAGDIEQIGEFRLVNRYSEHLKSTVLLIPHHGSRTSSNQPLLEAVQPRYGLISSGYLNRFGMPHEETVQRLKAADIELYNTAKDGQVTLQWHDGRWRVYRYRANYAPFWFNQLL